MFDPLSYIHSQRMKLPRLLDTPYQRGVINQMLIHQYGLTESKSAVCTGGGASGGSSVVTISAVERQLILNWRLLPYICTLIGAQLLKRDLGWRGELLRLSAPVRFFMMLSLRDCASRKNDEKKLSSDVQWVGLMHVLEWQRHASNGLKIRLALLFPPIFDELFSTYCEPDFNTAKVQLPSLSLKPNPTSPTDLFLISQAIQYAKNNPDNL